MVTSPGHVPVGGEHAGMMITVDSMVVWLQHWTHNVTNPETMTHGELPSAAVPTGTGVDAVGGAGGVGAATAAAEARNTAARAPASIENRRIARSQELVVVKVASACRSWSGSMVSAPW